MKIIDTEWTPKVNILHIRCNCCARVIKHRADRWWVYCPCGNKRNLGKIREDYVKDKRIW